MKLLNKKELMQLNTTINEKAVAWEDSILGKTTKAAGGMLSFLKGSINKGINIQKIKSLNKQWTAQFAKAVNEVYEENKTNNVEEEEEEEETNLDNYKSVDYKKLNEILKNLNELNEILDSTSKWDFAKLDLMDSEWKTFYSKLKNIKIEYVDFSGLTKLIDDNEYLKETKDVIEKLMDDINLLIKSNDVKTTISTFQGINKISDKIKEMYKLIETLINGYTIVKKEIDKDNKDNKDEVTESLILEKKFKLPKQILEVVPQEMIDELSKIKDIKKLTTKKLNFESLNTIMYNFNYIIEKEKNKKKNTSKLQRLWDLNYQNTNNYFQNVIDIDTVKKQVTGKVNNPMVIKDIEAESKNVDDIVSLGGTDVVNGKFNNKLIYLFVGKLQNYARKEKQVKLLMSPIHNFVDEENKHKIFWFKVFGNYTMNKKNQIIRSNPFKNLTNNKFLLDYGDNASNSGHFYIAIEYAITIGKPRRFFVFHANDGGVFMDKDFYKDIDKIKDKIINVTKNNRDASGAIKELGLRLNIFKFNITQRFNTDAQIVDKYPGITKKDVTNDNRIDKSQNNLKKIMNYINKNLKK